MLASHWERLADGTRVYFGPEDYVDGPVYVNDELNIYGNPRFLDLVRSGASDVHYQGGGDASVFEGGLLLDAPPLDFAGMFSRDHVGAIQDAANSGGIVFDGDIRLIFHQNGHVIAEHERGKKQNYNLSAFNGAIHVNGNVEIQGIVEGNVTVGAEGKVTIKRQGVTYESAHHNDPFSNSFNPDAINDSLGLISRVGVEIEGKNSINIHAAMLVTEDGPGFYSPNSDRRTSNATINLFGSVSQYRRGIVGRVDGRGFRKNYKYDTRFAAGAPPFYPYSGYVFAEWEQVQ